MSYNFDIAKKVLSETDKNRLLCLYLNCEPSAINWEKATRDFGAASVDSMRVMTRSALKKIEKAGGKMEVEAGQKKGAAGGKKRKGTDGEEGGDDEEELAAPKQARGGKKAKKMQAVDQEDDVEDGEVLVNGEESD